MNKTNAGGVFVFLVLVLAVEAGLSLARGALFVGKHEGDMLHLLEITFRMVDGEWPHLDFATPIGVLAFAPIVLFVKMGSGIGHAILYAQVLVGAALVPLAWRAGISRLTGWWPYVFGAVVIVLATALVHGEAEQSVSMSMHYNRWAWAAAFLALLIAVLPPVESRRNQVADGIVVGLALAFMALCKITFFAAFVIPVVLGLLAHHQRKTLWVGLLTGLAVALLVTVLAGPGFWLAYMRDLLWVAGSPVRAAPGAGFGSVVSAPAYLGGSLVALIGVVLLRQAGKATEGMVLLFLVPGFFYVTYQNFGNDPQWLLLLGIILFAARPSKDVKGSHGWDMHNAVGLAGAAAFAMTLPSAFNLTYSPLRHIGQDESLFAPMLPRSQLHSDLKTAKIRSYRANMRMPMDEVSEGMAHYAEMVERDPVGEVNGEEMQACEILLGLPAWLDSIAQELESAGYSGTRILWADLFSSIWLYGDFKRLENGAPWYYGGLPGIDSADYVLVPHCPVVPKMRRLVLEAMETRGIKLNEVHRTPLFILFEKGE